jgi:hypothetical protein
MFGFLGGWWEGAVIGGLGPVRCGGRVLGGQKKARLRKARRLLIVPFKTKVFLL